MDEVTTAKPGEVYRYLEPAGDRHVRCEVVIKEPCDVSGNGSWFCIDCGHGFPNNSMMLGHGDSHPDHRIAWNCYEGVDQMHGLEAASYWASADGDDD